MGHISSKVSEINDERLNTLLAECGFEKLAQGLSSSSLNFEEVLYAKFPDLVEVSLPQCMVASGKAGEVVSHSLKKSSEYLGLILQAFEELFPGMYIPQETMKKVKR
jgi:hypothetical protein